MKHLIKTGLVFLAIIISGVRLYALGVNITATAASDGKSINMSFSVTGISGSYLTYAVVVESQFDGRSYNTGASSLTITSSPGVQYTITVTGTYYISNIPHTVTGSAKITTPNGPPGGGASNCSLILLNGLTFPSLQRDGTPEADGQIIIFFTPTLDNNGHYLFRYRVSGTTTWLTTPAVAAGGSNNPGQWILTGLQPYGVEYEIQVAYSCALPNNLSSFSSSYYAYTLE